MLSSTWAMTAAALLLLSPLFLAVEGTQGPWVIAHRGASTELPENTMAAFARALNYSGVAGIETDLRLSKDGVIVLIHDATLNRTTNGTGNVVDYTAAQLQQFSAGYPKVFGDKYLDLKIPTFKEALNWLLSTSPNTIMIMDLKVENLGQAIATTMQEVSQERNTTALYDRVVASCWTDTQVDDVGQYLNITVKQKLGSAPQQGEDTNLFFSNLLSMGIHAFSLNFETLSSEFIDAAHVRMMPVVAWTVDEQSEMVTLIQMGVDGIITNVPGEALGYVTEFIAGNSASSDDQFSVSDMVWVALGSAGGGAILGGLAVALWAFYKSRSKQYERISF